MIILLAIGLLISIWSITYKINASPHIRIDFDEPIYYRAGVDLARCLINGNITCLATYDYNIEHPFLGKIIYGLISIVTDHAGEVSWENILYTRSANIFLSSLTPLLLTLISPFAGVLYAGDALSIKYGLEVYLDGFTTLFVLSSYIPLILRHRYSYRAIVLSGIFAGLAMATKYTSIPALLPIPIYLLSQSIIKAEMHPRKIILSLVFRRRYIVYSILWILLALLAFYISNPSIWFDLGKPLIETRLYRSITFHEAYATHTSSTHSLPFYQQFIWFIDHSAQRWHPGVFAIDTGIIILLLGLLGLPLTLVRKPLIAYWIISYTLFLLIWPVKWPQYTLLLTAPLSISSSILLYEVLRVIIRLIYRLKSYWRLISILAIVTVIPIASILPATIYSETMYGRGKYYIDTGILYLEYTNRGLKPINGYLFNGYTFIKPVERGSSYNLPYEYLPSNANKWPGVLYNAKYIIENYISEDTITGYTTINHLGTILFFEKMIRYQNESCIHIRYVVGNIGNKTIYLRGEPEWATDWGLGIELALSPPNPNDYKQVILTNNKTIITRESWKLLEFREGVRGVGLIDTKNGYEFLIMTKNSTLARRVWLEYGDKWITIRIIYDPILLTPSSFIAYDTYWVVKTPHLHHNSYEYRLPANIELKREGYGFKLDINGVNALCYILLAMIILVYTIHHILREYRHKPSHS